MMKVMGERREWVDEVKRRRDEEGREECYSKS